MKPKRWWELPKYNCH